jgi:hypothetical protein
MLLRGLLLLGAIGALPWRVAAQFPAKPEGVTVLDSQIEEGIKISYKEVTQSKQTLDNLRASLLKAIAE